MWVNLSLRGYKWDLGGENLLGEREKLSNSNNIDLV